MNIIQTKILTLFIFLFLIQMTAFSAQDSIIVEHQEKFYYEIGIINSYSILLKKDIDIKERLFSPTIRFKWKPNRNLSVGLESGYVPILSQKSKVPIENGKTNFEGLMYGIPAILMFNYELSYLYMIGGFGTALVTSKISAFDETITTTAWTGTYNYGLGLAIPLARNFSIGLEAKGFYFSKVEKFVGQAGINITYGFYGY